MRSQGACCFTRNIWTKQQAQRKELPRAGLAILFYEFFMSRHAVY